MANTNFDVIVFGSATVDVFLTSKDFLVQKGKVRILSLPYDAKLEVKRLGLSSGGGGTNVAVGLARLGLKTALVARFGQDHFAPLILEELRREGVNTRLLSVVAGEETDYSTILVSPDGARTILVARGWTRLEQENIPWSKLSASWFHLASLEGNLSLAKELITFAHQQGIKVAWNPGRRELAWPKKVALLAAKVEVLILNQEEWQLIGGEKKVFELPLPLVAVTRGAQGVCLFFPPKRQKLCLQAFSSRPVEATGAGDAFCSGLIAGLFWQKSPRQAARWGLANGASVVERVGAKSGLLTKREMQKWLRKK